MKHAAVLLLGVLVAFVNAANDLDASPGIVVGEQSLMSSGYDIVVYIGDTYKNLPKEYQTIEDAISVFHAINKDTGVMRQVIPFPENPSKKLIWATTGDLSTDVASSRDIRQAAEAVMKKIPSTLSNVLLVVGPLQTALPSYTWARGAYPKLTAALGALHSLYVPLQVREGTTRSQKISKLGLHGFDAEMIKFVKSVGEGMGVTRDIGDSDPVRMNPTNIVFYLNARSDWTAAGIKLVSEKVKDNQAKYPMAYAVNRATEAEVDQGQIVTITYTPSESVKQTLILVGKGVTLDTGGADVKTGGSMYGQHSAKLGAAAIAGFFQVLSKLKPTDMKVVGYMPFIRNNIGKLTLLPDEIVTLKNGKRVRIGNTGADGRNVMSDVLYYAREEALKSVNPHIFTIANMLDDATKAYGPYTATMDNGPAEDDGMAWSMMDAGDMIGDPTEVARIRPEDFKPNQPISEWEDIEQFNELPGMTSKRGFTFPMAYLQMASNLDDHGRNSENPIKYTHCDITGSCGGINTLATTAPLRMFAIRFLWKPTRQA